MAARPYWSGQIRLGLVFFPVSVYTATNRSATIPLHEYERSSGERIHHRNVNESGEEIERGDIVKGYEVGKGDVVFLEPDEIDAVKLPSSDTLELVEFVDRENFPITHFERPYYVLPNGDNGAEVYNVLREALEETGKLGIGQVTLRGREELVAVLPHGKGLVFLTLRYAEEVRKESDYFDELDATAPKKDYVALARELIKQGSAKLNLDRFHDRYHEALHELIKAKTENRAPRYEEGPKQEKVVDLMEALRRSLKPGPAASKPASGKKAASERKTPAKSRKAKKPAARRKTA